LKEPIPNNNEFEFAECALRKIGSNLWFSGLSDEWQDFLTSNTVEHFDTYEITIEVAASNMLRVYQELVTNNPGILGQNPWDAILATSSFTQCAQFD
jgi:hypothetical protein